MATTGSNPDKDTDDGLTECTNDWCDGPSGDRLPCFACFDPTRAYDLKYALTDSMERSSMDDV